jgi:hypothetical protein
MRLQDISASAIFKSPTNSLANVHLQVLYPALIAVIYGFIKREKKCQAKIKFLAKPPIPQALLYPQGRISKFTFWTMLLQYQREIPNLELHLPGTYPRFIWEKVHLVSI